jgi:hypothetical protein
VIEAEFGTHLTNGSATPDGNHVSLFDARVYDAVPGCCDHV